MPWFVKSMGDGLVADAPLSAVEASFLTHYGEPQDCPPQCALWKRHDTDGRLHCEVLLFFSPGAEELALSVGAHRCHKPKRAELSLVAGPEAAWELFFSED